MSAHAYYNGLARKAEPADPAVVALWSSRLETELHDGSEFNTGDAVADLEAVDRLLEDLRSSVTRADLLAIAVDFSGSRAQSIAAAVDNIRDRFVALARLRAKLRSQDGRSAF